MHILDVNTSRLGSLTYIIIYWPLPCFHPEEIMRHVDIYIYLKHKKALMSKESATKKEERNAERAGISKLHTFCCQNIPIPLCGETKSELVNLWVEGSWMSKCKPSLISLKQPNALQHTRTYILYVYIYIHITCCSLLGAESVTSI